MSDLLVIGDSAIDYYMKLAKTDDINEGSDGDGPEVCFYHGSKIPVDELQSFIAGNSVNVSVGCTKLGLKTTIYTEIGNDNNAERIIRELRDVGVNTTYCIKNDGVETDVHTIIVFGGERTIFTYHGKRNYRVQNWDKPKFIYLTSLGEGFQKFQKEIIEYIKANPGIGVAFNPGTIQMKAGIDSFKDFLEITDILFVNMDEAGKIVGEKPLEQIHIDLHKLGVKLSVITNGKEGANAFDGENLVSVNAYSDQRPVLDKTGAGDAFSSGFLSAIYYKKPLKEALAWGVVNSGGVIKEIGAIKGLQTKDKMEKAVEGLI